MSVTCPYCQQSAVLVTAADIGVEDRANRPYWRCKPCGAYIACYAGTETPLGPLADESLREAQHLARVAFRAFKEKNLFTKGEAFQALAKKLHMSPREVDFNHFDINTCLRVTKVLSNRREHVCPQ